MLYAEHGKEAIKVIQGHAYGEHNIIEKRIGS